MSDHTGREWTGIIRANLITTSRNHPFTAKQSSMICDLSRTLNEPRYRSSTLTMDQVFDLVCQEVNPDIIDDLRILMFLGVFADYVPDRFVGKT